MAEQQMEAKSKPVSPDDINNLSDNDYQKLLDEALNIKSVSPHDKSPMMRHLLKAVAIDDDDLASNVREMMDAMKESGAASTKKPRRRAKDDQQRAPNASVASRSIQGGSLQNLTGCDVRRGDAGAAGEGRGRGRLHKSGSVNSFVAATDDKLFSSARMKTRSRSHTLSGELSDSEGTRKCCCNVDAARCCQKGTATGTGTAGQAQARRKSSAGCGDGGGAEKEEIEMMEIGVSDEECSMLLKTAAREAQVDDGICLPLQVDATLRDCEEDAKVEKDFCGDTVAGNASKDGVYENGVKGSAQVQNKKKKNGKGTELVISNEFLPDKLDTLRPQLDVNGNPLNEHLRNMTLTSFTRNYTNLEPTADPSESSTELEKRRKHKRQKPSNTLKEMKAGDVQGNRGDDPLESLVEFINSSDKKTTIAVNKQPDNTGANNKIQHNIRAKKQEKENNKKNLPSRTPPLLDDETETETNGSSIFDLLDIETSRDDSPDLTEHVVKIGTVRKAHSWEGSTLPPHKVVAINCELVEVSSDGGVVFVPQGGNNTCEPAVISSFVTDFYEEADAGQLVEEPEFRIVIPKRHRRNNRYVAREGGAKRGVQRDGHLVANGDGHFAEDMMLLARLPIGHHRGQCDARRKSTSSMPPSEHSSVDNSDLDSVHSLPVKSTMKASGGTPQASYADIAKMAAVKMAEEMIAMPGKKKDASTCTTDDIPGVRKPCITHWASYPILNEATGKNDAAPASLGSEKGGGGGDSGCPSDESKRDGSSNTDKSFSSPESVEGVGVLGALGPEVERRAEGGRCGEGGEVGVGEKKEEEDEEEEKTKSRTNVAVEMPVKGKVKRKEAVCSPATTNSSSSEASDAKGGSGKRKAARGLPAVVIMNKLKGGSYSLDVSFGFEVNEQLLGRCAGEEKEEEVGAAGGAVEVVEEEAGCEEVAVRGRSGAADDGGFNYSNVVDFINQSWNSVVKEYEKEKFGAGYRHVKYLNDK